MNQQDQSAGSIGRINRIEEMQNKKMKKEDNRRERGLLRWTAGGSIGLFLLLAPFLSAYGQETYLSLREAIGMALERGSDPEIAALRIEQAEKGIYLGAVGLMPRVDLVGRYNGTLSNTTQEFATGEVNERNGAFGSGYSLGVEMNWKIFDGFGAYRRLDRLKGERDLAEIDLEAIRHDLAADVAILYLDIVRQIRLLDVDRETLALSLVRHRLAEARVETGASIRFELTQAQVDLDADSAALFRREIEIASSRMLLNRLLERPVNTPLLPSDTIPLNIPLPSRDQLREQIVSTNPQIRAIDMQKVNLEAETGAIRSEYLPSVSLDLGYTFAGSQSQTGLVLSNRSNGLNYGITASWNIFNGSTTSRRIEQGEIGLQSLELQRAKIVADLDASFDELYNRYESQARLAEFERSRIDGARDNLRLAADRLELGAVTYIEVRQAQTRYVEAESRLVEAEYARDLLAIRLLRLSGGIVELAE